MYGSLPAVRELSFSIEPGQCVGLLGPNGAGKSTTIRMIAGYVPPTAGRISVAGHDTVNDSIAARRELGYLPESTPLHPEMRVVDLLNYRAGLFGMGRSERRGKIESAMALCRVADVRRRRVGQLSKGYKQRVGLAMALVHEPRVLVLDEPTSGLDPTQIRETRSLIKDLAHKRTVLVSSHILPEIEQTCDRVLIMARGRLLADGSPASLTSGTGVLMVECQSGSADAARRIEQAMRGVPGVQAVDALGERDGWLRARAVLASGAAEERAREGIARALANAGVLIRELRRETTTLEQVFVRLIESERAEGSAEAAQQTKSADGSRT